MRVKLWAFGNRHNYAPSKLSPYARCDYPSVTRLHVGFRKRRFEEIVSQARQEEQITPLPFTRVLSTFFCTSLYYLIRNACSSLCYFIGKHTSLPLRHQQTARFCTQMIVIYLQPQYMTEGGSCRGFSEHCPSPFLAVFLKAEHVVHGLREHLPGHMRMDGSSKLRTWPKCVLFELYVRRAPKSQVPTTTQRLL